MFKVVEGLKIIGSCLLSLIVVALIVLFCYGATRMIPIIDAILQDTSAIEPPPWGGNN